ncbi:MAG: hypothetical protein R3C28_14360 [Pirellulaceae bacterium]
MRKALMYSLLVEASDGDDSTTATISIEVIDSFDLAGYLHLENNLIVNGSFELGPIKDGQFYYDNSLIPGWNSRRRTLLTVRSSSTDTTICSLNPACRGQTLKLRRSRWVGTLFPSTIEMSSVF